MKKIESVILKFRILSKICKKKFVCFTKVLKKFNSIEKEKQNFIKIMLTKLLNFI